MKPRSRRHTARQLSRSAAVPRKDPHVASAPYASEGAGAAVLAMPGSGGAPLRTPSEGEPFGGRRLPSASYSLTSPLYFQPPNSQTIRLQGRGSAQDAAANEVELAFQQLTQGNVGVLRVVNYGVNGLLGTSNIVFRVKVAGSTVPGWQFSPFAAPIAVFQFEFPPDLVMIEVPEAARISLTAEVIDAGTYDIDFSVQGWRYGRAIRDDFNRAWRAGIV